jgi:hypothetical protein
VHTDTVILGLMFYESADDDFLNSKHVALHRINVFTLSCVIRTYANTQVIFVILLEASASSSISHLVRGFATRGDRRISGRGRTNDKKPFPVLPSSSYFIRDSV